MLASESHGLRRALLLYQRTHGASWLSVVMISAFDGVSSAISRIFWSSAGDMSGV